MFEHEILKYILTFISCYMLAKNTVQTGSATFGHFYLMAQTETLIARDRGARARAARRRGHAARSLGVTRTWGADRRARRRGRIIYRNESPIGTLFRGNS